MILGICALPLIARAQAAGRISRIGILSSAPLPAAAGRGNNPWLVTLGNLGWIEGQNFTIERRYADGKADLLPEFARQLVDAKVDAIATFSSVDAAAAKRVTSTIPIVMIFNGLDPVQEGFVASFSRPGGNITGVSRMLAETRAKRLELVKAMLPSASRVGVLAYPDGDAQAQAKFQTALRGAARAVQVELQFFIYDSLDELAAMFPAMVGAGMHAFLLEPTFQAFRNRDRIAELSLRHRLPGVFTLREYAVDGGLMSYGPDLPTMLRQHAHLIDRILRGANPGDLPMEQPTRFDLVLNLKTAKALGLTIPAALLLRSDELIR